jgi:hypothetical protein
MSLTILDLLDPNEQKLFHDLSPEEKALAEEAFRERTKAATQPAVLVISAAEQILTLVANSSIIPKIAFLQRKYFTELCDQGFSPEQAIALVGSLSTIMNSSFKKT